MQLKKNIITASLLTTTLIACSVGTDYQRPDLKADIPEHFATTPGANAEKQQIDEWWKLFDDEQLATLIEKVLSENLELQAARERIIEARALRGIENAARLPQLNGSLGYTRAETGEEGLILGGAPSGSKVDIYSSGAIAGWELDLWGRVARLTEAADAAIQISVEDFYGSRTALAAETARKYFTYQALNLEKKIVKNSIKSTKDNLQIIKARTKAGYADRLDLSRAQRDIAKDKAVLPVIERNIIITELSMQSLLGPRQTFVPSQIKSLPAAKSIPEIGIPADLLLRRPDLRRAEKELHRETARSGAALAERFPSLSLSGTFALQGTEVDSAISPDSYVMGVGPSLKIPLFQGGRISAGINAQESRTRRALLMLRQNVRNAFFEVESLLGQHRTIQEQKDRIENALKAARQTESFAELRYKAGKVDYLEVVEARRVRLELERQELSISRDKLITMINLCTALGGGWTPYQNVTSDTTRNLSFGE